MLTLLIITFGTVNRIDAMKSSPDYFLLPQSPDLSITHWKNDERIWII